MRRRIGRRDGFAHIGRDENRVVSESVFALRIRVVLGTVALAALEDGNIDRNVLDLDFYGPFPAFLGGILTRRDGEGVSGDSRLDPGIGRLGRPGGRIRGHLDVLAPAGGGEYDVLRCHFERVMGLFVIVFRFLAANGDREGGQKGKCQEMKSFHSVVGIGLPQK